MSDLDDVLVGVLSDPASRRWARWGFRRNPYPSRSQPIWDVLHGQKDVKWRFHEDLKEFLRDGNNRTMLFTGGNRVGKTHFMEHYRRKLEAVLPEKGVLVPIAVVPVESADFRVLAQHIVEQFADSVRRQSQSVLFDPALNYDEAELMEKLPPGDLRRAVICIHSARGEERSELAGFAGRWLRGERVRAPIRRRLNVHSWLDSGASYVSALAGFIQYWRLGDKDGGKRPGVLVFLDEFELVRRARRDRRDQFLQALCALVDASSKGGLFLCVGMASGMDYGRSELETAYPALFARLKGSGDVPSLFQVGGVVDAIDYARAFEAFGMQASATGEEPPLLSNQDIQDVFNRVNSGKPAPQGDFFDALHTRAERALSEAKDD